MKINKPVPSLLWAASIALASIPVTSSAQEYCGQTSFINCLENGTIGYGTPSHVEGIEAIIQLRDSNQDGQLNAADDSWNLYRKLLGPRFTMPQKPQLRIIFNDLRLGHEIPVVQDMGPAEYDARYLEFGIQLLAQYGPHLGWRDVRLWLNNIAGFETGRQGTIAKFLSEMVYEQNPRRVEGYATSYAGPEGNDFVMRGDWRPAPDAFLALYPEDPAAGRRTSDGSEDGDDWGGGVSLGQFTTLPSVPYEWLSGVDLPADNPTAPDLSIKPVFVRIQLNPDFDLFNVPPAERQSLFDADPLPDLFDEEAGESWEMLIDVDQEVLGIQYGPGHGLLVAEGADITADGPCAERIACEGGPYLDERPGRSNSDNVSRGDATQTRGGGALGSVLVLLITVLTRRRAWTRDYP